MEALTPQDWNELCDLIDEERVNQFFEEIKGSNLLELELESLPANCDHVFSDKEAQALIDLIVLRDVKSERHIRRRD